MLIAHSSDLHITESATEGGATLDEQIATLLWIGADAASRGAALMLCTGDIFDKCSTVAERNAALEVFTDWAEKFPVVIVAGNHDEPHDLKWLGHLDTEHPVTVAESPAILDIAGASIACLPWPRKGMLIDRVSGGSQDDLSQLAKEGVQAILAGFKLALESSDSPTILAAHAELGAASMDNGQPVAGRCFVELGEDDLLDVGADYVALGHIHKHQVLSRHICYAGSPRPTKFGEEGDKGYCLVDIKRDEPPVVTHRKAPYRELLTFGSVDDCDSFSAAGGMLAGNSIRIKYSCDASERESRRAGAEEVKRTLLAAGAASVKIDAKTTTTHRVRSTEVASATTTAQKLRALWVARGSTPEREPQIIDKLKRLELGE